MWRGEMPGRRERGRPQMMEADDLRVKNPQFQSHLWINSRNVQFEKLEAENLTSLHDFTLSQKPKSVGQIQFPRPAASSVESFSFITLTILQQLWNRPPCFQQTFLRKFPMIWNKRDEIVQGLVWTFSAGRVLVFQRDLTVADSVRECSWCDDRFSLETVHIVPQWNRCVSSVGAARLWKRPWTSQHVGLSVPAVWLVTW